MKNGRTTVFGFLGQIFMVYGITNALLNIFVLLFGESAKGYSSIFSLGSGGVGAATCFEFLAAIAVLTALRLAVMSGRHFTRMAPAVRIALLFVCALAVIIVFNAVFGWFPSDDAKAWIMFIACFIISCAVSIGVSALAQRQEDKKLEKALARLKEEEQ